MKGGGFWKSGDCQGNGEQGVKKKGTNLQLSANKKEIPSFIWGRLLACTHHWQHVKGPHTFSFLSTWH